MQDHKFKVVLLGEGRTGKTSILLRYINNSFSEKQTSTFQASYQEKVLNIGNNSVSLAIWDTAGQERFHALAPIYYRDAHAAVLVYDITDKTSFQKVQHWAEELKRIVGKDIIFFFSANKMDLESKRQVDASEVKAFASSVGATVIPTSAKSGKGINDLFSQLAMSLLHVQKSREVRKPRKRGPKTRIAIIDDGEEENTHALSALKLVSNPATLSINQSLYSFDGLKKTRQFSHRVFISTLIKLIWFPITLTVQYMYFKLYSASKKKSEMSVQLLPNDFNVYDPKSRLLSDFMDPLFRSANAVYDLENAMGTGSFAEQTKAQLCIRCLLIVPTTLIYSFIWISAIYYNSYDATNKDDVSLIEAVGPLLLFIFLIFSMSAWAAYRSKLDPARFAGQILKNPLCFTTDNDQIKTNVVDFLRSISVQVQKKQRYRKRMNILFILASVIYSMLPSISRVSQNRAFFSENVKLWLMCFCTNTTLIYICIILCKITTTAAFDEILELQSAISTILSKNNFLNKKRFYKSNVYLPFLNLTHTINLPSWIQLRSYLFIQGLSSMNNVEIWMGIFIAVQIPLFGYTLFRFVSIQGSVISDPIILACVFGIAGGALYIYSVAWIGKRFDSVHTQQIKGLISQSTFIDHVSIQIRDEKEQKSNDEENKSNTEKYNATATYLSIQACVGHVRENNITPQLFGVELDKVLWKSLIGIVSSLIASGIALYVKGVENGA